jgi:hypothetical protein
MIERQQQLLAAVIGLVLQGAALSTSAASAGAYPVAGLTPYQRPANAPVLVANRALDGKTALHGVSSPTPDSLKFLGDQGAWFTPFIHPGMTGPYDLRGWHSTPAAKSIVPVVEKK